MCPCFLIGIDKSKKISAFVIVLTVIIAFFLSNETMRDCIPSRQSLVLIIILLYSGDAEVTVMKIPSGNVYSSSESETDDVDLVPSSSDRTHDSVVSISLLWRR